VSKYIGIAFDVPLKLRLPKLVISTRGRRPMAVAVSMPEAPVNEDRPPAVAIGDVGGAWKIAVPHSVAEPERVESSTSGEFRFRISLTHFS